MGGLSNDGPASHLVKIWRQKSGPNDGPVVDQARGMALHADPCNTQGGADPCNTQGGADPCNTQGGADPCNTQGGADPCNTQGGADPCNTQGGADPSQGRIAYGGWVLKVFEASRG